MVKKRDIEVSDENIERVAGVKPAKAPRKRASAKKAADHVGSAHPEPAPEATAEAPEPHIIAPPRGRPTTSLLFQAPDLPPLLARSAQARTPLSDEEGAESPTVRRRSRSATAAAAGAEQRANARARIHPSRGQEAAQT